MEQYSGIIIAIVGVVSGSAIVANFLEIQENDKPWVKVVKKCINIVALNFSAKAGK